MRCDTVPEWVRWSRFLLQGLLCLAHAAGLTGSVADLERPITSLRIPDSDRNGLLIKCPPCWESLIVVNDNLFVPVHHRLKVSRGFLEYHL